MKKTGEHQAITSTLLFLFANIQSPRAGWSRGTGELSGLLGQNRVQSRSLPASSQASALRTVPGTLRFLPH